MAVALGRTLDSNTTPAPITFSELTVPELLEKLHPPPPVANQDDLLQLWEQFSLKKESPFSADLSQTALGRH